MMKDLRDKVVLITGAARGMGRLDALAFAREGCRVVIADVDGKELDNASRELEEDGYRVHSFLLDVSDRDACFRLVEKVEGEIGPIEVLVNNAGVMECGEFTGMSERHWRRTMEVNFLGQVWLMQAVLPGMLARHSGHVVNMASQAGIIGGAKMSSYSASKHAVMGVTDSVRLELRGSGVRFTDVIPGFVETGMASGAEPPFISPWVDPARVSQAIVNAVKKGHEEVCRPAFSVRLSALLRGLASPKLLDGIYRMLGGHKVFDTWRKDPTRPF
ncbi:MAG: SDR family NAD(P)-dependent oxidoreductase [Actinobacteria bacterium]|jgi:NAD(P)-dependent dehydrogenase (short-subunit alcohol dehydrogenase family)|nr:MAG: SDR family NAD(P)-dependent oxidoreductase [Actinomycetota bacterium]